jgi:transcriptional antiterminator RfaH
MSPLHEPVAGPRKAPGRGFAATVRPPLALPDDGVFAAGLPWYVVHTKVRQEQTACENLARQGYTVYLPRIKRLKRVRGHQQAQMEPLFPRYLFLQPGSSAHSIAPVRSTLGVATIVRYGQEPAVMRPETLSSIVDFEARWNQSGDEEISPFQRGELVRVVDGPLSGLEGLISGVSQERVVVLMQLLGADTRVSLSHHQLLVVN